MDGRGSGLGAAAWWWLRWGDVDGSPGLGLGCSRLLFNTCEVDAPTLMERKKKGVRKVPRVSLDLDLVEFSFVHIASIYLTIL